MRIALSKLIERPCLTIDYPNYCHPGMTAWHVLNARQMERSFDEEEN